MEPTKRSRGEACSIRAPSPPPPQVIERDPDYPQVEFISLDKKCRVECLKGKEIHPIRWLDKEFINQLGIDREMKKLFQNIGTYW